MKTSEVLRKAGDVLRGRGWCTGTAGCRQENSKVCILGAIANVTHNWLRCYDVSDFGSLVAVTKSEDIYPFNDAPGRTAAEVMIALDAAYVLELQEEGVEPEDIL